MLHISVMRTLSLLDPHDDKSDITALYFLWCIPSLHRVGQVQRPFLAGLSRKEHISRFEMPSFSASGFSFAWVFRAHRAEVEYKRTA